MSRAFYDTSMTFVTNLEYINTSIFGKKTILYFALKGVGGQTPSESFVAALISDSEEISAIESIY